MFVANRDTLSADQLIPDGESQRQPVVTKTWAWPRDVEGRYDLSAAV